MQHKFDKTKRTESILDEIIEGVAIAIVGELIVRSRELLEALRGDASEISAETCILGDDHRSSSHKTVDQRLLHHFRKNPDSTTTRIKIPIILIQCHQKIVKKQKTKTLQTRREIASDQWRRSNQIE